MKTPKYKQTQEYKELREYLDSIHNDKCFDETRARRLREEKNGKKI